LNKASNFPGDTPQLLWQKDQQGLFKNGDEPIVGSDLMDAKV
jgi:hypothetical protein